MIFQSGIPIVILYKEWIFFHTNIAVRKICFRTQCVHNLYRMWCNRVENQKKEHCFIKLYSGWSPMVGWESQPWCGKDTKADYMYLFALKWMFRSNFVISKRNWELLHRKLTLKYLFLATLLTVAQAPMLQCSCPDDIRTMVSVFFLLQPVRGCDKGWGRRLYIWKTQPVLLIPLPFYDGSCHLLL